MSTYSHVSELINLDILCPRMAETMSRGQCSVYGIEDGFSEYALDAEGI